MRTPINRAAGEEVVFVCDYGNCRQRLHRESICFTVAFFRDGYFKDYIFAQLERKHAESYFGTGSSPIGSNMPIHMYMYIF